MTETTETLASYMDSLGLSAEKHVGYPGDGPNMVPLSDEEVEAAIKERFPDGAMLTSDAGWVGKHPLLADPGYRETAREAGSYRTLDDLLAHARHLAEREGK